MRSFFRFDTEMSSSLTASFFMASALCFHFFGYEMARAASIALLAAKVHHPNRINVSLILLLMRGSFFILYDAVSFILLGIIT